MEKTKTRSSKKNTKSIFNSKETEEMFDKEERHRHYLVGSICRDTDELYAALMTYNDPLFCQDVIVLFQNVVYDFVTLMEWCRLKSLYRELPPPVRINFSECFGERDAFQFSDYDHSVDDVRLGSVVTNGYKNTDDEQIDFGCKKSGTNVSAPDFVPTKDSQSPLTLHEFNTDRISRGENRTSKEVFDKQIDELTSEFLYSGQRSNDLTKNVDQIFRYQQPLPPPNFLHYPQVSLTSFQHHMPHYLTHFHLPYSVCTNGNLLPLTPVTNVVTDQIQASSDVRNSLLYGYPIGTISEQRLTSLKLKSRKSNSQEKHNVDNNYSDSIKDIETSKVLSEDGIAEYEGLTENNDKIPDCVEEMSVNISSNLNTSKIFSSETNIDKTLSLSHFASPLSKEEAELNVGGPFSKQFESDQNNQNSSASFKMESQVHNEKQNVLGLPEKECQLQFPELKPYHYRRNKNFRRKHFPRVKFQKCTKVSLGIADTDVNMKSRKATVTSCDSGEVIFSGQTDRRSLLLEENKRKNINSKHYAAVRTKPFRNKPSREEKSSRDSVKYTDYLDSNIGESDGWKMVKVRTKMRDKYGSKQININKRLPVFKNSSFSAEHSLLINKDNFTCNSQYMLRESNPNYERISAKNENVINNEVGLVKSEHNLFSQSGPQIDRVNNESVLCPEEAGGALARILRNGSEKSDCGQLCLTEDTDPVSFTDLPLPSYNGPESTHDQILRLDPIIENIVPNEMYSVYMKYLNNTSENLSMLQQFTDFENSDSVREQDFQKKLEVKTKHEDDTNTITKNEVKQQQAHEKRLQLLQCKTAKIREFVQKVQDVKAAQYQLALQRKTRIDLKLKKAEENRNLHLSIIRRKAHDEEEKLKEIAFINELEAQNRRHDSLALRQEHEERLQYLIEERQRRLEEKAAKEAAVEERRRVLEAERQEKLEKMQEKRRRKEEIIGRKQQEKEKERLVIAREKAREREERLQARHAAQLATLEELQKRIQQKQEESARRHEENIELIRQKALEVGLHRSILEDVPTTNWYKSDDQPKIETSFNQNSVQEKMKAQQKKRLKKIKLRMETRGSCFRQNKFSPSNVLEQNCELLRDHIQQLEKLKIDEIIPMEETVLGSVDHIVEEILKLLRTEGSTQVAFKDFNGFILLESIFKKFVLVPYDLLHSNVRTIGKLVTICDLSLKGNETNCSYLLMSNCIAPLLDLLKHAIQVPVTYLQGSSSKPYVILIVSLLNFLNTYFSTLDSLSEDITKGIDNFPLRVHDLVSYVICSGLIAKIIHLFRISKSEEKVKLVLLNPSIGFFSSLLTSRFKTDELLNMLQSTELLGTVPLLYEGLVQYIYKTGSLPDYTLSTINFLIRLAKLDLKSFQTILGAGDIGLQFRGIASGLMTFCVKNDMYGDLLHLVIIMVGYFALHNKNNQTLLQSGKQPTVLQQLVNLPFQYFCDPSFMKHLFPTLIACSYHNPTNRAIVEDELNYSVLEDFIASDEGKKDELVRLCTSVNDKE